MTTATETKPQTHYGVADAARYLGLPLETFKNHLRRNADALPYRIVPANGRKSFSQETLDKYRQEWLSPQPAA